MPALKVTERGGRVRLDLAGLARGEGSTLQDAADELIRRVLELALVLRSSGCTPARELGADLDSLSLLHEVADIAARGGDIRARIFL